MSDRRRNPLLHAGNTRGAINLAGNGSALYGTANGALTAATQTVSAVDRQQLLWNETWQNEAWAFYESLGEFNYGVEWFGEALSRVRLTAAKVMPGGDEPRVLDDGPAVELMKNFMGGVDGQSQLLRSVAIQLAVVGDTYFVGRSVTPDDIRYGLTMDAEPDIMGNVWTVQPINTLRRSRARYLNFARRRNQRHEWEMQVDENVWIALPYESHIIRIWDRNEHLPWRAMSPGKPALPILREIDMYNRHIMASLVSRVAMNGMFFIPDEVTMPSAPEFEDAVDPFVATMHEIMRSTIKNPGTPASAAPLMIRVPEEHIDKFKHLTFSTPLDGNVFEARMNAIRRLAATLNLPAEIVNGFGSVNHWTAWQITEDAIKVHIAPKVEIITRALTLGYLQPMLSAMNESSLTDDGSRIIVWYDTSELTQRPDRSSAALTLREMMVISDKAARRETGFDESDAPTDDELERMILMKLAINPRTASAALEELTGLQLDIVPDEPPSRSSANENPIETTQAVLNAGTPVDSSPNTQNNEESTGDAGAPNSMASSAHISSIVHRVKQAREHDANTTLVQHVNGTKVAS